MARLSVCRTGDHERERVRLGSTEVDQGAERQAASLDQVPEAEAGVPVHHPLPLGAIAHPTVFEAFVAQLRPLHALRLVAMLRHRGDADRPTVAG